MTATALQLDVATQLRADLLAVIEWGMDTQERSMQTRIGPSEIGVPCARRIGYRLANVPACHHDSPWLAAIGTAVHSWLEDVFTRRTSVDDGRWWSEQKVPAGRIGDLEIDGTRDLYDARLRAVVDFKVVGAAPLREYVKNGPGEQYRAQVHCYAAGTITLGQPVDHVACLFLPRGEPLSKAHLWLELYDPAVAEQAFERANGIATLVGALGGHALPMLPTADAHCKHCPWLSPGSSDVTRGCPGDPEFIAQQGTATQVAFSDLINPAKEQR